MDNPVPAGIIENGDGSSIPVFLDISYLLGPDTAHVNVSGISGNSKTSYLIFLLQSTYQRLRKMEKGMLSLYLTQKSRIYYRFTKLTNGMREPRKNHLIPF
jgi:hypothetical protein